MPIFNSYLADTTEIVANGTYDVTQYTRAIVNVQNATTSLNVTPSKTSQYFTPVSGTVGYSSVNVGAVTSSIDANIIPENIKKGVSILGVTGTYEGEGGKTINYLNINNYINPIISGNDYWAIDNNLIKINYTAAATEWSTCKYINLSTIKSGTVIVTLRGYVSSENNYDWGFAILGTQQVTPTTQQLRNGTVPTGGNSYLFRQSGLENTMSDYSATVNVSSNPILSIGYVQDTSQVKGDNTFYIESIKIEPL